MVRFNYHFEPTRGWMNDPNGLCVFKGKYHAFFQYNPYAPKWDTMHWGHAVSDDLISWTQIKTALTPSAPYENKGGCFSGSALAEGDRLYLFYTSDSKEYGQTQSMAFSKDGIHFEKYENNPIIKSSPLGNNENFRDPKVFKYNDSYYMVCGAEAGGVGKILLFSSINLFDWNFVDSIFESAEFGGTPECPDLFKLGDRWVLLFSAMKPKSFSSVFALGDFDGSRFKRERISYVELGPDFYAPQTFCDGAGRRIMIGWMYHWGKRLPKGAKTAGALSVPRELSIRGGRIRSYPVAEARRLLKSQCEYVSIDGAEIAVKNESKELVKINLKDALGIEKIERADILYDVKAVEIFINGGEASVSQWLI